MSQSPGYLCTKDARTPVPPALPASMKASDRRQTGPGDHMGEVTGHSARPAVLTDRLWGIAREVAKFGAVGAAGVLVNIGVFNLVRHYTDLQVVRAGVIATVVAIVFNY